MTWKIIGNPRLRSNFLAHQTILEIAILNIFIFSTSMNLISSPSRTPNFQQKKNPNFFSSDEHCAPIANSSPTLRIHYSQRSPLFLVGNSTKFMPL